MARSVDMAGTKTRTVANRRGVGVLLSDLTEESKFGASVRREIIRWFPRSRWVADLDARPEMRQLAVLDRRRFLIGIGLLPVAAVPLIVPVTGCGAAASGLLFEAVQMAATYFTSGSASSGNALFSNGSPSREAFQMLTSLFSGAPTGKKTKQDENQFDVNVPANADNYMHFFGDLVSSLTGDHFVSGKAIGDTKNSEVFQYQ
jgi:hypothetical protein